MADYWEPSGDEDEPVTSGLGKREKRLARNRESARKCRKKRKAYVGDLQSQVDTLGEENALLLLENQRLLDMIKQLQDGDTTVQLPESNLRKRVKSENGVSMATDFSESAAFAFHSQQLEDFSKLAIMTTFLLLSTTLTQLTSAVAPAMMMQLANHAAAHAPALQPCSRSVLSTRPPHLRSSTGILLA